MTNSFKRFGPYVLALGLLILVLVAKQISLFSGWESLITDSLFVPRTAPAQVSVVAIDEPSLEALGAWPWNREVFAELISKLAAAKARVAAFDVTFFEEREGDAALAASLTGNPISVVLAGKFYQQQVDGQTVNLYKTAIPQLLSSTNTSTGYANLEEDTDEKVRQGILYEQDSQGAYHPSLAYAALLAYFGKTNVDFTNPPAKLGFTQLGSDRVLINYFGPKASINTISLIDILQDEVDLTQLSGDLVFVGSTVQDLKFGLDDNFVSPLGAMPGVEIHANLAATVIDNSVLRQVPVIWELLLMLIVAVLFIPLVSKRSLLITSIVTVVGFVVFVFGQLVLFNSGYIGDYLYTPLLIVLLWFGSLVWRYILRQSENAGLKRAFTQYVNNKLLQQILADPTKLTLGGERREMSVMFTDIRGFTAISEQLKAEQLVEFLNGYLTAATDQILATDGVVDKYLGDAIMALWNAPLDDALHVQHAAQAAVAIVGVLGQFNQKLPKGLPALAIGIGINTGEMVVGNMGSAQRFDYTVMGDNVNLASRLEGLTRKYDVEIILGPQTAAALKKDGSFTLRHLDKVTVKGKSKPLDIYQLLVQPDKQLVSGYEQALKLYLQGEFGEAAQLFQTLSTKFAHDAPTLLMRQRCKQLAKSKPTNWPGYWEWGDK